jgi:hypothetical protein
MTQNKVAQKEQRVSAKINTKRTFITTKILATALAIRAIPLTQQRTNASGKHSKILEKL